MELLLPVEKYYQSYAAAVNEYKNNHVDSYHFFEMEKRHIFNRIENFRLGTNLPENYVSATYLWLIDNDEFIGEISIRHRLTSSLLRFGGNIGYGIRFSKWNNGYGTIMLANALTYAKEVIGLDKVLITCNNENVSSSRIIEKNGGILQDRIKNVIESKEILTKRYWIAL